MSVGLNRTATLGLLSMCAFILCCALAYSFFIMHGLVGINKIKLMVCFVDCVVRAFLHRVSVRALFLPGLRLLGDSKLEKGSKCVMS